MTATKAVRAAEAIKANPGKSDRAIAAEIGVNQSTVSRVHKSVDANASPASPASPGPDASPAKRIGRDGKSYPAARADDDDRKPEASCGPRCVQCGRGQGTPDNPILECWCVGTRVGWLHRNCQRGWLQANPPP